MKKLVVVLMVVALACTCAFAGVKVGASIGRDTIAMGLEECEKGAVALGLDVDYVFDEGISLFADGTFILGVEPYLAGETSTWFAFEAGVGYVLPFDLPFNIEVGAGIKTKIGAGFKDTITTPITKVGGVAKLGLSVNLSDHFELGFAVSEQLAGEQGDMSGEFDFAKYLAANTGFKATVKYAF